MLRKIPLLILIAGSLTAAVLLFAVSFALAPLRDAVASAYMVLEVDESAPDRELTEALSIMFKGKVLSESSQWVFLDDFGELQQIPLDEYDRRVEPFDPRNDGYAARVRSFFVRNGKRFFFIPRPRNFWEQGNIEKNMSAALDSVQSGLSWSLTSQSKPKAEVSPHAQPGPKFLRASGLFAYRQWPGQLYLGFCLILFAAAVITGFFLLKPRLLAAVLFPVLAGLCLWGAPGFALAAILSLLAGLLPEPVRELCYSLGGKKFRYHSESRSRLLRNSFAPHRFCWFFSPVLLLLYGFAAAAGRVPLSLAALTFICFSIIFFFFFLAEANRDAGDHVRFVPVLIMPVKRLNFPKIILPFAFASCLAFIFSGFSGGISVNDTPSYPPPISAAEYQVHGKYQKYFSLIPLGGGFDEAAYFHYNMDEDGLIENAGSPIDAVALPGGLLSGEGGSGARGMDGGVDLSVAFPPFPLASVMSFLAVLTDREAVDMNLFEFVPVLLVLLLSIPAIGGGGWGRGKKKRPAIYNDKRIAA
jgi:hypothetical protein